MNGIDRPIYKRPCRYKATTPPWCEIAPPEKWVYPYDAPEVRKTRILAFLTGRGKPIAARDLENVFCYSMSDVTWSVNELFKEGRIKREIRCFGKRRVAFVSAV